MLIFQLFPDFKRYALHERGITLKSYRHITNLMKRFSAFSKCEDTKDVSTNLIRDFLYHGKEYLGWTNKTFVNHRQAFISFFEFCKRFGYMKENPASNIKKPKVAKSLPRFLSKQDIQKIIDGIHTFFWKPNNELIRYRNIAIILTFMYTGMRLSELLKLRSKDLDFENRQILIVEGKGKKDRIVPIHEHLIGALRRYNNVRNDTLKPSNWFFTGYQSSFRLYPKNIHKICSDLSVFCSVKFTPHVLRHSFARTAIANNFNLFKLQQIMGHSSISTTQIYLSTSRENMQSSFQKIRFPH